MSSRVFFFDCAACRSPLDDERNLPHSIVEVEESNSGVGCESCFPDADFVEKPIAALFKMSNIKRTEDGWHAIGPMKILDCGGCNSPCIPDNGDELHRCQICPRIYCAEINTCEKLVARCCKKELVLCSEAVTTAIRRYNRSAGAHNRRLGYTEDHCKKFFARLATGHFHCDYCVRDFKVEMGAPMSCKMIACPECREKAGLPNLCKLCRPGPETHLEWAKRILKEWERRKAKKGNEDNEKTTEEGNGKENRPALVNDHRDPGTSPNIMPKQHGTYIVSHPEDICRNCKKTFVVESLFCCLDCEKETFCGACYVRGHKEHNYIELKDKLLTEMEDTTRDFVSQHYEALHRRGQDIQAENAKNANQLLAKSLEGLKLVPGQTDYASGAKICVEVRVTAENYEKCFEKLLLHVHIYNNELQELTQNLANSLQQCAPK
ncbi:unnamed protein product, partial [Mesorhabditis spiculigera]